MTQSGHGQAAAKRLDGIEEKAVHSSFEAR
jgi:hypothetical protein